MAVHNIVLLLIIVITMVSAPAGRRTPWQGHCPNPTNEGRHRSRCQAMGGCAASGTSPCLRPAQLMQQT